MEVISDPLLKIENVVRRFSGMVVLNGISFDVEARRIQGVIGPNGAGKTTLFNVINGIFPADAGRILFRGIDITRKSLPAIASLGIGRTFQVARVFNEMTLLENMLVPAVRLGLAPAVARRRAEELLTLARLECLAARPAVEISGGQKKLLEFVRTMMSDPALRSAGRTLQWHQSRAYRDSHWHGGPP